MPRHRFTDPSSHRAPARRVGRAGLPAAGGRLLAMLIGLVVVVGLVGLAGAAGAAVGSKSAPSKSGHTSSTWQTSARTAQAMGTIMDPTEWYLTLPTGSKGDPNTVAGSKLDTFSCTYFHLDPADDGLVFSANAGGVTTSGSSYPRSELREMNGTKMASWSDTVGTNTMEVRQAVTALPRAKPEVVTAQIHDSSDDVMEIRLEGTKLIAAYNDGKTAVTIDPQYVLGTVYDLKIVAADGRIKVFYNGAKKADIARKGSGWYFKSGSYIQSNTSKGDKTNALATVVIYQIDVTHTS